MKVWIIEPRDPVIFRDARPFSSNGGGRSVSLPFPFPSTIAGGVRTRAFLNERGSFDPESHGATLDDVRRLEMCGPFLVELKADGSIGDWLFPAPLDALAFKPDGADEKSKTIDLKRLVPLALPEGVQVSRPFEELCPVGLAAHHKGKPSPDAPKYWKWSEFKKWLSEPGDRDGVSIASLGHDGPQADSRTHVGLDPETLTSEDGRLFQTRGLEFTRRTKSEVEGVSDTVHRLAIAIEVKGDERLRPGLAPLGGERRLVEWRVANDGFPPCPDEVRKAIARDGACRMILTTPGYFSGGWRPSATTLNAGIAELNVEIVGAVVPRPVVVSGWDFENDKAKPTRRLVPAGSVYFLKLSGPEAARAEWIKSVWSSPVTDDEQSRRDGFGCALLGAWNGQPVPMEVN